MGMKVKTEWFTYWVCYNSKSLLLTIYKLTVMKIYTPAANIVIGTFYIVLMAAIIYITKKSAQLHLQN